MKQAMAWLVALIVTMVLALNAYAGTSPPGQYDVSISVAVTPSAFQPGDRGTVTLALHNAGPDPAGSVQPGPGGNLVANFVIGPGFRLATAGDWGPFDIIYSTVSGCLATFDVIGPGPPPNFFFGLVFQFYFAVVPPGESLTCTFDIVFLPTPFETFESRWRYEAGSGDTNPGNNEIFYTIVAGTPYQTPAPIPALSWWGQAGVMLGLGLLALRSRRFLV